MVLTIGVSGVLGLMANVAVVVAAVILLWEWAKWRDWGALRRLSKDTVKHLLRFRGPVQVRYFLPSASYLERTFIGAGSKESCAEALTVGVGTYDITVRIDAHTEVTIEQLRLAIDRGSGWVPTNVGIVPSRFSRGWSNDLLGRPRYVDWNKEIKVAADFMTFPRHVAKGDYVLATMQVQAQGGWEGSIVVTLMLQGHFTRSQVINLPLEVDIESHSLDYLLSLLEPA